MCSRPSRLCSSAIAAVSFWGLVLAACALLAPGVARAQCSQWIPGPFQAPLSGANGRVYALAVWTPPGGTPLLYAAGAFTMIDGMPANHVAAWDGLVWRTLGQGVDDTVLCLTVYNGTLVAGGRFENAGGSPASKVAYWNGVAWHPMSLSALTTQFVYTLAAYNGTLVAGGNFTFNPYSYVAQWNGSAWGQMGGQITGPVRSLAVYNNQLWAGGDILMYDNNGYANSVATWNGSAWSGMESSPDTRCMVVYNGSLFAGGLAAGAYGTVHQWNGSSWNSIGDLGAGGDVYALAVHNGSLYAAGDFTEQCYSNGGLFRVAVWNGRTDCSAWSPVGSGFGGTVPPPLYYADPDTVVRALVDYAGALFAGGSFSYSGNNATPGIAEYLGYWTTPAQPNRVYAVGTYGSKVAMGGHFAQPIGGSESYYLTDWDGLQMSSVGFGTDAPVYALKGYTTVSGVRTYNNLVVGGTFTHAGGLATSHVATWTEANVYPYSYWSAMGSGLDNAVLALDQWNGNVIAGGQFLNSGSTPTTYVAQWDGTSWQPMWTGMNGPVHALKSYNVLSFHDLVAGGDFTTANGSAANRIAICSVDNFGRFSAWAALGSGFNGTVNAIERYNGSIYAAGTFTFSGGTPVNYIARWTGSAWVSVGTVSGGGFDGYVYALRVEGGYLYAAGSFSFADDKYAPGVARWDGTNWSPVDYGIAGSVFGLAAYNGEVWAGGQFDAARQINMPVHSVARFLETGAPWIAQQPSSQTVNAGDNATFSLTPAAGYSGLSFSWRRDAVPLSDGPSGHGTTIGGSSTNMLTLYGVNSADSATYDCVVSNNCGAATSAQAALVVNSPSGVADAGGPPRLDLMVGSNPAVGTARLRILLPTAAEARLDLFDLQGRRVAQLLDASLAAGAHDLAWSGPVGAGGAAAGARVASPGSGIYLARLSAGGVSVIRRIIWLR